jgi:hypothetical protein
LCDGIEGNIQLLHHFPDLAAPFYPGKNLGLPGSQLIHPCPLAAGANSSYPLTTTIEGLCGESVSIVLIAPSTSISLLLLVLFLCKYYLIETQPVIIMQGTKKTAKGNL